MNCLWNKYQAAAPACLAAVCLLVSSSCSSTSSVEGLPTNLPAISLSGTSDTPAHAMPSYEYPFDSNGRYVAEWAAEGERKAGRPATATRDDYSRWSGSHGGAASKRKTASKTAKSKSKGGRSYTVKKGDTLGHIAAKYGTTVTKIKSANGMKSDFLSIGKVLRIP